MTPDDDMISAWLDGSLDDEGTRRMADLVARDEAFARRVERLRRIDDLIRAAVPAEEGVPDALLQRLGLAPAAGKVVDIAAVRAVRAEAAAPAPRAHTYWRMAAQLALVAGLGLAVFAAVRPGGGEGDPVAQYRALGAAPDADAGPVNALVKFRDGVGAEEASRLARGAGLRLIGSPNASGTWKAAVEPARRSASLDALRADPHVVLAEPIDGAGQ